MSVRSFSHVGRRRSACQANICSLVFVGCSSRSMPSTGWWTLLEERGPLSAVDAARSLFATPSISGGLARSLLEEVIAGDSRVACAGTTVSLAGARHDPLLEEAEFVVFDLETTGLSAARDRICEIGAVRVRALELVDSFQSLVNPGVALPEPIARLTGLRGEELRRAPSVSTVLRRFLALRRRRPARRAQRPVRPALPRAAAAPGSRSTLVRAAALHGGARPAAARGTAPPRRPRLARPLLRRFDERRVTVPCPTPRRRPRSSCT